MRPIDADATITKIAEDAPDFTGEGKIVKAFILAMLLAKDVTPTIDTVQVIRCGECARGHLVGSGFCVWEKYGNAHYHDWFCADGERR